MVEEMGVEVDSVVVEAATQAIVVVEAEAEVLGAAVAVVAEAITGVVETLEVEELAALTVGVVGAVLEAVVLESREGTWPFFSIFSPVSSRMQRICREHPSHSGRTYYR